MSKAEILRQMAMEENEKQPTAQELSEAIAETAEAAPKTPDELAQLLEPLMSVMLKLLEDSAHRLEELKGSSTWIKKQHEQTSKTWDYYLAKLATKVGEIQSAQQEISKSAQTLHMKTQEVLQHRESQSKLRRWLLPFLAVAITSLLWSGFVLWRMPDYATLQNNQSMIYYKIEEMEKRLPNLPLKGTK